MPSAIPELVLVEARQEWLRQMTEKLRESRKELKDSAVGRSDLAEVGRVASRSELEANYDKAVEELTGPLE